MSHEPFKKFIKRYDPRNNLELELKRIKREEEVEATPWPDGFREGQRVRRTRNHVFGADRGAAGELGRVVSFLRREPEPYHALYLVCWDRAPLGEEYVTHNYIEGVNESLPKAFVNALLGLMDAEAPKAFLRRLPRHWYEIHVDETGDGQGSSAYIQYHVTPPVALYHDLPDGQLRDDIIKAAVASGKLLPYEVRNVDYVSPVQSDDVL